MKRLVVLISGRGSNMEAIARETGRELGDELGDGGTQLGDGGTQTGDGGRLSGLATVVGVVANSVDAGGLAIAAGMGIPTAVVESRGLKRQAFEERLAQVVDSFQPDLVVLAGFMRRLSPWFVQRFRHRIVNIHPADTRFHQGLHGYQWAYERELSETRVTVHFVDEGLDTGAIIGQCPVDLTGARTLEEVEHRGLKVEHWFYSEMIAKVITGNLDVPGQRKE